MRRAARTDANHKSIVDAFRELGCSVLSLAAVGKGCPDLLVSRNLERTVLVEVKDGSKPPSRRRLTDDQWEFQSDWRGKVFVCKSIVEVPAIVESMK